MEGGRGVLAIVWVGGSGLRVAGQAGCAASAGTLAWPMRNQAGQQLAGVPQWAHTA